MFKLNIIVGVVIGASAGALLRWWLSVKFNHMSDHFFLGTLLANAAACALMGFFLGYEEAKGAIDTTLRIAVMTGFLGSLSTFSTFIGEVYGHLLLRDWLKLILNFNLQIGLGLVIFHFARSLARNYT